MGVMEAEGTVWGDWGGVTAGEEREGLSEVLPPASLPFSLYRRAPAGKNNTTCNEVNRTHNNEENKSKNKLKDEKQKIKTTLNKWWKNERLNRRGEEALRLQNGGDECMTGPWLGSNLGVKPLLTWFTWFTWFAILKHLHIWLYL